MPDLSRALIANTNETQFTPPLWAVLLQQVVDETDRPHQLDEWSGFEPFELELELNASFVTSTLDVNPVESHVIGRRHRGRDAGEHSRVGSSDPSLCLTWCFEKMQFRLGN